MHVLQVCDADARNASSCKYHFDKQRREGVTLQWWAFANSIEGEVPRLLREAQAWRACSTRIAGVQCDRAPRLR